MRRSSTSSSAAGRPPLLALLVCWLIDWLGLIALARLLERGWA
jgi:hypothetical protein